MRAGVPSDWYSANELAALSLPGIPTARQKVAELAASECWQDRRDRAGMPLARRRKGRGGGFEYHLDCLPAVAREALALCLRAANDTDTFEPEQDGDWLQRQSATVRAKAAEREGVVRDVLGFEQAGAARSIAVAKVAHLRGVSPRTIWDWLAKVEGLPEEKWGPALAPRRGGGKPQADVDPEAWAVLTSLYLSQNRKAWRTCCTEVAEDFCAPRGITLPNSKTLFAKLERDLGKAYIRAMRYGEEAERRLVPPLARTVADLHAMQIVNIDGHKLDFSIRWKDGTKSRPILIGIQDVYSRKMLAWTVAKSETMAAVRKALANLFRDWGIPRTILMDNGRAFAGRAISGGQKNRYRFKVSKEEIAGVLTLLGVEAIWALPYRGSSKPIEREWKRLCEAVSKHPRIGKAYLGNKPENRPRGNGGEHVVDEAEALPFLERKIAQLNARRGRETEMGMGKYSADEVFEASYSTSIIRKARTEDIRTALLEGVIRRADRQDGSVTISRNRYWHEALNDHLGENVIVRFDPDNLHSSVQVCDRQGREICIAPIWEAVGFLDKEAAAERAKLEKAVRRKHRELDASREILGNAELADLLDGGGWEPPSPALRPAATALTRPGPIIGALALKPMPAPDDEISHEDFKNALFAGMGNRLRAVK